MRYDSLIRGGRVIDPANSIDGDFDVALSNGVIAAVAPPGSIAEADCGEVFDATRLLVMPGLVDAHAHGFKGIGFGQVDFDEQCLSRCTTTVVDAGSSGCNSFSGFREYIIDPAECRVLALLNISMLGCTSLAQPAQVDPKTGKVSGGRKAGEFGGTGGHNQSMAYISAADAISVIEENRDVIVGVKCLLTRQISGPNGENEPATYAAAQEAASATGLPLMTHHSWSTIPLEECPGNLRPGDIYTHCFHPYDSTIMQVDSSGQPTSGRTGEDGVVKPAGTSTSSSNPPSSAIHPAVWQAKRNGVLFDIGFGRGSFSWPVAEQCWKEGFAPDIISTDIWSTTHTGPCYDLPSVMTRMLCVGMPLPAVVRASTLTPAEAIGWADRIGTLGVGRCADVAVLELRDVDFEFEDVNSQLRRCTQRLLPAACWRGGKRIHTTTAESLSPFPNPMTIKLQADSWNRAVYRDAEKPPALIAIEAEALGVLVEQDPYADGDGTSRRSGSSSSGGVKASPTAAGGDPTCDWLATPDLRCAEALQWPGGPTMGWDDTCCGPMAVGRPPLIAFNGRQRSGAPRF